MRSFVEFGYIIIWCPQKYTVLEKSAEITNEGLQLTWRHGAVVLIPLWDEELMRGADLPVPTVTGIDYRYISSWSPLVSANSYNLTLPKTGIIALHNSSDNFATFNENIATMGAGI